ncbi:hypothetical protein F2P81_025213 [Scophthalmus maximus]|uniref:Uncharacterized protein n=1 Tax=Scophthalmus maximus TaxID=52904 RepID=A0A6A4RQM8_SCOMX|nr:hypothetical protein F2P81_025213 [Scophthalmus maximus]
MSRESGERRRRRRERNRAMTINRLSQRGTTLPPTRGRTERENVESVCPLRTITHRSSSPCVLAHPVPRILQTLCDSLRPARYYMLPCRCRDVPALLELVFIPR